MSATFYLHEDDWGMIELLPSENMSGREQALEEAKQFGAEHFDGTGWTDIYVIPEAQHSIVEKQIALDELRALVGTWLPEADVVQSGYSTQVDTLENSFAFKGTERGSGAFYGNHKNGLVTQLNILRRDEEDRTAVARFAEALCTLGERHSLILTDWWSGLTVDLRNRVAVSRYLQGDVQGSEDNEPNA